MDITLIIPDDLNNIRLINNVLNKYKITKIHVGTTKAFNVAKEFTNEENIFFHTKGRKMMRLYDAIRETDNTFIFYNGQTPTESNPKNGYRTSKAYTNALNSNKNMYIFPYKAKSLDIIKNEDLFEISFFNRLQKGQSIKKLVLEKSEIEKLIENLKSHL